MSAPDPFSLVYDALWRMLEAHGGFTGLVKVANRIRFDGPNRDPIKPEVSTADLPEVRLVAAGGSPHLQRTSNSSSIVKRFEIQVSTGDQRVDEALFPVEWEIYRAMSGWAEMLSLLTWSGRAFVKLVKPAELREGVTESDLNRGIKGWAAIWACEVEMWFTTTDLAPVAP